MPPFFKKFFKEANETYKTLQAQQESIGKRFTCDKNTPLENLLELLNGLEVQFIINNKRRLELKLLNMKLTVCVTPAALGTVVSRAI